MYHAQHVQSRAAAQGASPERLGSAVAALSGQSEGWPSVSPPFPKIRHVFMLHATRGSCILHATFVYCQCVLPRWKPCLRKQVRGCFCPAHPGPAGLGLVHGLTRGPPCQRHHHVPQHARRPSGPELLRAPAPRPSATTPQPGRRPGAHHD